VGATDPITADVRIVAATHRDLRADMDQGRFREDLFYRLHVVPLSMPPLRDRTEDIPLLAEVFLTRVAARHGLASPHIGHDALASLLSHDWPGNVRELANVVEGAALLSTDGVLHATHVHAVLPKRSVERERTPARAPQMPSASEALPPLREAREAFDRAYLEEALRRAQGNVSAAAKLAGRNRTDFYELLRRYEIDVSAYRS
jgi:two-component system response regulator GlrR